MKFTKQEVYTLDYMGGTLFCTNNTKRGVLEYEWTKKGRHEKHYVFGVPCESDVDIEAETLNFIENGAMDNFLLNILEEEEAEEIEFERQEVLIADYLGGTLYCAKCLECNNLSYDWISEDGIRHGLFLVHYDEFVNLEDKTREFIMDGSIKMHISNIQEED